MQCIREPFCRPRGGRENEYRTGGHNTAVGDLDLSLRVEVIRVSKTEPDLHFLFRLVSNNERVCRTKAELIHVIL